MIVYASKTEIKGLSVTELESYSITFLGIIC